jgi:hypothetical protein
VLSFFFDFFLTTCIRVGSTRIRVKPAHIFLFSITRMHVKSTRTAAHKSYRAVCRIDTQIYGGASLHDYLSIFTSQLILLFIEQPVYKIYLNNY